MLPPRQSMSEFDEKQYDQERATILARQIPTGFDSLDDKLTIIPGLYVLGAPPSLGKSTFCWQLANNFAQNDDKQLVLYFAMEQSERALETKALSRLTRQLDPAKALGNKEIHQGQKEKQNRYKCTFEQARDIFRNGMGARIVVYKNRFIDEVLQLVNRECEYAKKAEMYPPIVFIDYLQILLPPADMYLQPGRTTYNYLLSLIGEAQGKNDLIVFLISSISREYYYKPVTMEAFKETGNIEFDADVLLGLQYTTIQRGSISEKDARNVYRTEKSKGERALTLSCLKDREYSDGAWNHLMTFEPEYSIFSSVHSDATERRQDIEQRLRMKGIRTLDVLGAPPSK